MDSGCIGGCFAVAPLIACAFASWRAVFHASLRLGMPDATKHGHAGCVRGLPL